jgi:AcrR family transcriptional regulator
MALSGGLRERKKVKTRRAIQREALRLFLDRGYEQTTVEQVAEAAEVSVSTFFRYFATKEDVVLTDDYDPLFLAELDNRPADEALIGTLRHAIVSTLRAIMEHDRQEMLARIQLISRAPDLQARYWQEHRTGLRRIVEQLRFRSGSRIDEFDLRVVTAALIGAVTEAELFWAENDGIDSLVDLVDRALQQVGGFVRL